MQIKSERDHDGRDRPDDEKDMAQREAALLLRRLARWPQLVVQHGFAV
jgi:hypothetical protein